MRIVAIFVLACTFSSTRAADDKAVATKKEFEKLQGTWKFVSIETIDGMFEVKDVPVGTDLSGFDLVISGMTMKVGKGKEMDTGTLAIDPTTTPKLIDIEYARDKFTLETIYELKGDTLKICFRRGRGDAKERPTSFTVKSQPTYEIRTYQREKSK